MGSKFHEMTEEELQKQLELSHSEIRELRFTYAVARSLQDPARVRKLKRNVARILTVLNLRKLGKATVQPKTESDKGKKKKKK